MSQDRIDLTRYHFKRDLGDITLFGTWIFNEDQEDTEPCLVLLPRYRLNGVVPCCIALSAAYKYDSPAYCVRAARLFARDMGFADSMSTTNKIAEIIHSHLLDLITMPVDPTQTIVVGEVKLDLGNGRKETHQVVDHIQIAQI